jgi:AcrR family transcriptional regulator
MSASPQERPDRREQILAAALALFAERGFHGTAVPEVAERARVGAGTIYRYFESKEALVNVLYKRWKGAIAHAVMTDFPFGSNAREQFHAFFTRSIAFAENNPLAFKFLELHHHAQYLDDEARSIEAKLLEPAIAYFENTRQSQITKPLAPELLMAILWGAIVGVVKSSWEGRVKLTRETVEAAESCCWEAIRG